MPPMTMVFRVGAGDARTFQPGDRIRARLVRDEDGGFRLVDIWKLDEQAAIEMRAFNERLARQAKELGLGYYFGEGDAFPSFALVDQYADPVTPERYRGKPFVMNFIFTRCTDGDMCPLSTSKMAELQELARAEGPEDLEFISVTLDPKFDTPGVLRDYADAYQIEGENFRFVTGPRSDVKLLLQTMAVAQLERSETIIHSMATILVDRAGKIVKRSTDKNWDPVDYLKHAQSLAPGA